MKNMILYGSKYGTSERYAKELSKLTKIPAVPCNKAEGVAECDTLIYIGGVYAGSIRGLARAMKMLPPDSKAKLIVASVGLSDPADAANNEALSAVIRRQVPQGLHQRLEIFHLRGGMDYQKLNFLHKQMMKMMVNQLKKAPPETLTEENRSMIDSLTKNVDFVNPKALDGIVGSCKAGGL